MLVNQTHQVYKITKENAAHVNVFINFKSPCFGGFLTFPNSEWFSSILHTVDFEIIICITLVESAPYRQHQSSLISFLSLSAKRIFKKIGCKVMIWQIG